MEFTGSVTVKLWASSSAIDTDFTEKLLDMYPGNDDYPDVNPNAGEPLGRHSHTAVANNAVYHDVRHLSRVVLPIVGRGR